MRTFKPKLEKYDYKAEDTFKFATFNKNLARVKAAIGRLEHEKTQKQIEYETLSRTFLHFFLLYRSIINWDNQVKSAGALVGFIFCVWNFQLWMIPFGLLLPLVKSIIYLSVTGGWHHRSDEELQTYENITEVKDTRHSKLYTLQITKSRKSTKLAVYSYLLSNLIFYAMIILLSSTSVST